MGIPFVPYQPPPQVQQPSPVQPTFQGPPNESLTDSLGGWLQDPDGNLHWKNYYPTDSIWRLKDYGVYQGRTFQVLVNQYNQTISSYIM